MLSGTSKRSKVLNAFHQKYVTQKIIIMSMTTVIKLLLVWKVQRIPRKHALLENKYNQYSM